MPCTGFEGTGHCYMCGNDLPKRRRSYCSNECSELYANLFFWDYAKRNEIHSAHWRCRRCGVNLRHWYGDSQVHHIEPINGSYRVWNVLNVPWNLRLLCSECHLIEQAECRYKEKHKLQMNLVLKRR